MQTKKFFVFSLFIAVLAVGLSSCSKSDDGDSNSSGSGNGTANMKGQSVSFSNAWFYTEQVSEDKVACLLQFYNCDLYGVMQEPDASQIPDKVYGLTIRFKANVAMGEVPTGEFSNFDALLVEGDKQNLLNGENFSFQYGAESGSIPVSISKSGSSYTVSFASVDFINHFKGNDHSVDFSTGFSYTGPISAVPSGYFEAD